MAPSKIPRRHSTTMREKRTAKSERATQSDLDGSIETIGRVGKIGENDSHTSCTAVSLVRVQGELVLDIRRMYKKRDDDEWLPTGKGRMIPFVHLIEKAKRIVKKKGLK